MTRLLSVLLFAFALAACASNGPTEAGRSASGTIEVSMSDELRFEPAEFTIAPGETVRFEVTNDGGTVHEFLIGDEAAQAEFEAEMAGEEMDHDSDAGVSVEPGQTETFDYDFGAEAGELLAGCHEPGHYDAGMVATITISE